MDSSEQRFAMRWSRLTWVVTIGVGMIVVLVAVVILRMAMHVGPGANAVRAILVVIALLAFAIFGIVAFFAPLGFTVTSDAVVVRRLRRDVVIPRREIREIRRVESGGTGFTLRLCGSGGFLGWFGLFYSRSLGEFWAYAGNQEDLVVLTQSDGTKIVLSPYPPDAFLKAVQETRA